MHSYTDSYLHKVCNLSLNSDKSKYLILATPPTAKYYFILYMYRGMGVYILQMYGAVYRCRGHADISGYVLGAYRLWGTYKGCTHVWGKQMGRGIQMYWGV